MDYVKSFFGVSFLLIIISHLAPNEKYKQYIKMLIGIIMASIVIKPVLVYLEDGDKYVVNRELKAILEKIDDTHYDQGGEGWLEEFLRNEIEEN